MNQIMSKAYEPVNLQITTKETVITNKNGTKRIPLNITLADIRKQITEIGFQKPYNKYNYMEYKSEKLEGYNMPYMNFVYYFYFCSYQKIPTLDEMIETYLSLYCEKIDSNNTLYRIKEKLDPYSITFTKKQVIGRIFRSYNSFHREIELFFQLKELGLDVTYDFKMDLKGIDIIIRKGSKEVDVASYQATKNSIAYKGIKNTYRHDYTQYKMINIEAVTDPREEKFNCVSRRGIYTYNPTFIKEKFNEICQMLED